MAKTPSKITTDTITTEIATDTHQVSLSYPTSYTAEQVNALIPEVIAFVRYWGTGTFTPDSFPEAVAIARPLADVAPADVAPVAVVVEAPATEAPVEPAQAPAEAPPEATPEPVVDANPVDPPSSVQPDGSST